MMLTGILLGLIIGSIAESVFRPRYVAPPPGHMPTGHLPLPGKLGSPPTRGTAVMGAPERVSSVSLPPRPNR